MNMKFVRSDNIVTSISASLVMLILLGISLSTPLFSQKSAPLVATAILELCQNGVPYPGAPCSGSAWVNSDARVSNTRWRENDLSPYRLRMDGLQVGPDSDPSTHVYSVVLAYDVKRLNLHAIDYLGTYNATNSGADPCSGLLGCSGWGQSTFPIPADTVAVTSQINPSLGVPVSQSPGVFTLWGGTLRSVSYSSISGPMTDPLVERRITLTFTAQVQNPVLAWSGHFAWVGEWGTGNTMGGGTSGFPFHFSFISLDGQGPVQDLFIEGYAVASTAALIIRKEALTVDGSNTANSLFPFTADSTFLPASFTLTDNNPSGPVFLMSTAIRPFGPANAITVTEELLSGWSLSNLVCSESLVVDSTIDFPHRQVIAVLSENEVVVCTFFNSQLGTTAAQATISGRVAYDNGVGIRGAILTLININTGQTRTAVTNSFGNYVFSDLVVQDFYVLSVRHKKYAFLNDTRSFTLFEDLADVDFYGSP